MLHVLRDIAVFIDASPAGEKVARQAAELARKQGAHLVGVYGLARPLSEVAPGYIRGTSALGELIRHQRSEEEAKIVAAGRAFTALADGHGITSEFRVVRRDSDDDGRVLRALHCDLIVSAQPKPEGLPETWTGERLLLETGTPVLMIPSVWRGEAIGQNIVIAWNRSREARRVVGDAMPFVQGARRVTVLTVDADKNPNRFDEEPGANLCQHLSRHDVQAEVVNIPSHGAPVADVILRQADLVGADLLVAGAYSRPRASELLFGSTTRALLAKVALPLILSR